MVLLNSALLAFVPKVFVDSLFRVRTPTEPIPMAIQKLWDISIKDGGGLYGLLSSFGGFMAVFATCYFSVKLFRDFEDGNSLRTVGEKLIAPLLVVVLLSNGGSNFSKVTLVSRDIMNNMNSLVNQAIDAEVSIRAAGEILSREAWIPMALEADIKQCAAAPDTQAITGCLNFVRAKADAWVGREVPGVANNAEANAQLNKWNARHMARIDGMIKNARTIAMGRSQPPANGAPAAGRATAVADNIGVLDGDYYSNPVRLNEVVSTIMSFKKGFSYILDIMQLVIGLVGPFFVGLLLFPNGARAFTAWGLSFLSVGFCKICFSLISGLSSIAFVYAGPDNVDMTVVAVVPGLLSPALAVMIATTSGLNALGGISQVAQAGNFALGLNQFKPGDSSR
jgi:hypothetical protein